MKPLPSSLGRRQAGFTIIEMMIALVLLLVGLLIAADLLTESSRMFVETSGEALDTPAPLADARIRADVQGATSVAPVLSPLDGKLAAILVAGGGQEIVYQKTGDTIYRVINVPGGPPQTPVTLWRGVTDWKCEGGGQGSPALLTVTYTRRSTPHTPLPVLPAYRGPLQEEVTEVLYILPRGNGW
ncbi:MAG TPA: prepilin-type N-terminal cleavage/methylation domain-containing protein [Thermoanaerobaculia bacterium]|nr:prepilin-type N-terminal cleavage/methylation domain-containing protein [Thermoanaerobaculia bacterium]